MQGFMQYILRSDITAQDVTQYKIKGYWYFDKRQSENIVYLVSVPLRMFTMNSDEKIILNCFGCFFPSASGFA
jgi:hypothetical protein